MLMDRICRLLQFDPEDAAGSRLLVVGAGAAGATAAIRAATQGITTVLVDKRPFPFAVQRMWRDAGLIPRFMIGPHRIGRKGIIHGRARLFHCLGHAIFLPD